MRYTIVKSENSLYNTIYKYLLGVDVMNIEREFMKITVAGVGCGGINSVCRVAEAKPTGVTYYGIDTDTKPLRSAAVTPVAIDAKSNGRGCGGNIALGKAAAEGDYDKLLKLFEGTVVAFVAVGLGGGTGSGAAPIVAKAAKQSGALTIAVLTKPFEFEGNRRMAAANAGLEEIRKYADAVIIIPNENVKTATNTKITFMNAFRLIDDVLCESVLSVLEILTKAMLINIDIADINAVLRDSGDIYIGNAIAEGVDRTEKLVSSVMTNALLEHNMDNAKGLIIFLSATRNTTLDEITEISDAISAKTAEGANIIWGFDFDDSLGDRIKVSVIASGVE